MIGQALGGYRVIEQLGTGGMGVVYVGQHELIGKRAAVKVLLPELSRDAAVVRRFFNEARAATQVRHPGIVEVFDFGHAADGSAYIVMELLHGEHPLSLSPHCRDLPGNVLVHFIEIDELHLTLADVL